MRYLSVEDNPIRTSESLAGRLQAKLRYYGAGAPWYAMGARIAMDSLAELGLRIEPFDVCLECRSSMSRSSANDDEFSMMFLTESDMSEAAAMRKGRVSEEDLIRRLRAGSMCLGARSKGELIGFTWCSTRALNFESHHLMDLTDGEASLFDAYIIEAFRGRGIAQLMRHRCYEELATVGRTRCYSVTAIFNTPAARFKQKLGASIAGRGIYFELLKRKRFHILTLNRQ